GLALAVLAVLAASAYFRLDLKTHGSMRTRLKLAAVCLVVAGGLVVAQFRPIARVSAGDAGAVESPDGAEVPSAPSNSDLELPATEIGAP
ncbi:MAG: hypothetical protein KY476_25815, partial [Planctomycetes bacterium]|nr:hypothetical protein [Planctomycetota bacterium]